MTDPKAAPTVPTPNAQPEEKTKATPPAAEPATQPGTTAPAAPKQS